MSTPGTNDSTSNHSGTGRILRRRPGAIPALLTLLLVHTALGIPRAAADTYLAVLGGEPIFGVAPPTPAFGRAVLTLGELDILCFSIDTVGLAGSELSTELWARRAEDGDWAPVVSVAPQRSLVASPTTGCVGPLAREEITALEEGNVQVIVRTESYPEGEIQGRVVRLDREDRAGRSRSDAFGLEAGDWEAIESLVELEEDQWVLLERLLKLTPDGWQLLKQVLQEDGEAFIDDAGRIVLSSLGGSGSAVQGGDGLASRVTLGDLNNKLNSVLSYVRTINTKSSSILATVGDLSARVPDHPGFRALVGEVDPSQLQDLVQTVRDEVSGAVETIRFLREGFDQFAPGGSCTAGSPCSAFKAQLGRLLDDLEAAWDLGQQLLCVEYPALPLRPLRTQLARDLLDKAPPVVLYGAQRVLQEVDGWDSLLADAIASIPPELTGFCLEDRATAPRAEGRLAASASAPVPSQRTSGAPLCAILSSPEVELQLKLAKGQAKIGAMVLGQVEKKLPDDQVVGLAAVAVGGGGGTVSIQNPAKDAFESAKGILEKFENAIGKIEDLGDDCEEAAFRDEVRAALLALSTQCS